jgi:ribosomal-protein-alanine N-acetyltransferase
MLPDQLDTAHLTLRPFKADDASAVLDYWQSDPSWERYNASVPEDFHLADAEDFVNTMCSRDRCSSPSWALVYQGTVGGIVSLTLEQSDRVAVIGYGVHSDLRGQGLSVEAAFAVIDQAFEHYAELKKIRAHTDPENVPSMRVLEKLGFSHEGTLRKNQFVKGRFVDEAIFGILCEEWDKE